MRPSLWIPFAFVLVASCATNPSGLQPGHSAVGKWQLFYSREFPEEARRLDYFYDQSRIYRSKGHVVARWKVLGSTGTTTLYVTDISCREGTYTERGTVIVDANGRVQKLPRADLGIDLPIEAETSSDLFRKAFCG